MAITESVKHVAARCNNCGASITGDLNYFQLTFQKKVFVCKRCKKSILTLEAEDGENVNISVPCPACGEVHSFKRKLKNFFNTGEELFRFACPLAPVDVFLCGKKEKAVAALAESKRELERLINEFREEQADEENSLYDEEMRESENQMRQMIEDFVYECANNDAIVCRCKNFKCTDRISLEKLRDGVRLTCKHCKRSVTLNPDNGQLLEDFVRNGKIIIDD